jgi:probable rRNA maturation factor
MDLVFRNSTKTRTFGEAFFRLYIKKTLSLTKESDDQEVSVNLVGPQRIRSLNRMHRHKDRPTDVLSFPLGESTVPGYTKRILGDIFICPAYAIARAREEKISLKDKMAWLMVHGMLHLLGYDHEQSSKEARRMEKLENLILKPHGKQSHNLRD